VAKPNFSTPASQIGETPSEIGRRHVYFDGAWLDTPVHDRFRLVARAVLCGPAIVEEMSATTLLPPGQRARVDSAGNLIITVFPE